MIKGVIFDMDGVLVDNRDAHIEAFEIICRKYGVPFDREKFMPSFGMTNDLILERLMPEVIRRTDWRQKADGFLVGLGSSGNTPNVNFVLERCGIAKYFDAIANGDMISRGKPDPEVYLLAARKLGLAPAECIVAEDAPVGIEAARRAGMSVIGVATTFRREDLSDYDLLIDDFTQIGPQQIRALKA